MTQDHAVTVMSRLGLPLACRMNRLPGNPKMMLGLEAAFALEPDVIVVELDGVDPMGSIQAVSCVSERLESYGAIYVCHPYWTEGQQYLDFVPGLPCYQVKWTTKPGFMPMKCTKQAS